MKNRIALRYSSGLSLVELLVTLAIMGIVLTWATSDATNVRQKEKVDSAAQSLMDTIHYSQDYARHLSIPSALCAGTPADQCKSTNWSKGWTLFRANQQDLTKPLEAVRTFEPNLAGLNVQLNGLSNTGKIIINGEGFIFDANKNTTAVICDKNQAYHTTLEIQKAQTQTISSSNKTIISEKCQNATT